jgi:hypothetical protein
MRAVRLGWKLSAKTRQAISAALTGKRRTSEQCRKFSISAKKRGAMPPWVVRPWTDEEVSLLKQLSNKEVAERIGRSVKAVREKQKYLTRTNPDWETT